MGMYDSVYANCPVCDKKNEFQSKGGDCQCDNYTLQDVPDDVLGDCHGVICACKTGLQVGMDRAVHVIELARVSSWERKETGIHAYMAFEGPLSEALAWIEEHGERGERWDLKNWDDVWIYYKPDYQKRAWEASLAASRAERLIFEAGRKKCLLEIGVDEEAIEAGFEASIPPDVPLTEEEEAAGMGLLSPGRWPDHAMKVVTATEDEIGRVWVAHRVATQMQTSGSSFWQFKEFYLADDLNLCQRCGHARSAHEPQGLSGSSCSANANPQIAAVGFVPLPGGGTVMSVSAVHFACPCVGYVPGQGLEQARIREILTGITVSVFTHHIPDSLSGSAEKLVVMPLIDLFHKTVHGLVLAEGKEEDPVLPDTLMSRFDDIVIEHGTWLSLDDLPIAKVRS